MPNLDHLYQLLESLHDMKFQGCAEHELLDHVYHLINYSDPNLKVAKYNESL